MSLQTSLYFLFMCKFQMFNCWKCVFNLMIPLSHFVTFSISLKLWYLVVKLERIVMWFSFCPFFVRYYCTVFGFPDPLVSWGNWLDSRYTVHWIGNEIEFCYLCRLQSSVYYIHICTIVILVMLLNFKIKDEVMGLKGPACTCPQEDTALWISWNFLWKTLDSNKSCIMSSLCEWGDNKK